jgi:hypothetical protein
VCDCLKGAPTLKSAQGEKMGCVRAGGGKKDEIVCIWGGCFAGGVVCVILLFWGGGGEGGRFPLTNSGGFLIFFLPFLLWLALPHTHIHTFSNTHTHAHRPPPQKKNKKRLGRTLFDRLMGFVGATHATMLTTQYRMHADICRWASEAMYQGRLTCV